MNRKMVLFRYEMKSMIVFLVLGLAAALFVIDMPLYTSLEAVLEPMHGVSAYSYSSAGYYPTGVIFGGYLTDVLSGVMPLMIWGFVILSAVQFGDLQSRAKREFMNSLPFSQSEKFCMKVLIGYGMITVCWLAVAVPAVITHLSYSERIIKYNLLTKFSAQFIGADTIGNTIRVLVLFWLTLLALYSVFMAVAYLVRSTILHVLVGIGALYWPYALNYIARDICQDTVNMSRKAQVIADYRGVLNFLERAYRYVKMFSGNTLGYLYGGRDYGRGYVDFMATNYYRPLGTEQIQGFEPITVAYGNMWISYGIAVGLIVFCLLLAWWVNQKQDLARIQKIFPSKIGRIGINFGVSTSLGAIAMWILFGEGEFVQEHPMTWMACAGLWLLISAGFYLIFRATRLWERI